MTKSEFKKLVAKSPNINFLSQMEINVTFSKIGEPIKLKSLVDLYDYVYDQNEKWKGIRSVDTIICEPTRYTNILTSLEDQIQNYLNTDLNNDQLIYWQNSSIQGHLNNIINYCSDFNNPKIQLIIEVSNEYGNDAGTGAYYYFKESYALGSLNISNFKGLCIAYEFETEKKSAIFSRTKKEIQGINKINEKYQAVISEINSQHVKHLAATNANFKSHLEETDSFRNAKETIFDDWFSNAQKTNSDFENVAKNKIFELEEIYEKKLQLQAPAKYWDKKSKEYLRQAILTRNILTIIIAVFGAFFASILVISPDWIFKTVFEGNKISIVRWSVVFIALISLLVFIVKAITKIMFSSFHLARDAEERHTLTFFYLALLNDPKSEIKDEERKMIIQSLFSRVDTGLLKGDSSPEMPNDFLGKFLK